MQDLPPSKVKLLDKLWAFITLFLLFLGAVFANPICLLQNCCIGATDSFACGDVVNESCTMNGNLSMSGGCLTAGASNLIIDCAGYSIDGIDQSGNGISADGLDNITIKNCDIYNNYDGLELTSTNSTALNSTFHDNSLYGMYGSMADNLAMDGITTYNNLYGGGIMVDTTIGLTITNYHQLGNDSTPIAIYASRDILLDSLTSEGSQYQAVQVQSAANLTLRNLNESGGIGAIYLYDASEFSISNLTVSNTTNEAIYLDAPTFNGIIENGTIMNCYNGAFATGAQNLSISNLIISDDGIGSMQRGINIQSSVGLYITNNTITNFTDEGIYGVNNLEYYILGNHIGNSPSGTGIVMQKAGTHSITTYIANNIIYGTNIGLYAPPMGIHFIRPCSGTSLNADTYYENNTITGANIGIYAEGTEGNFFINNFVNATTPVSIDDHDGTCVPKGRYRWTAFPNYFNGSLYHTANLSSIAGGYYFGGNYWGTPSGDGYSDNCTDANSDGICDNPYLIPYSGSSGDMYDYLPLTYFNWDDFYNNKPCNPLVNQTLGCPISNQNNSIWPKWVLIGAVLLMAGIVIGYEKMRREIK